MQANIRSCKPQTAAGLKFGAAPEASLKAYDTRKSERKLPVMLTTRRSMIDSDVGERWSNMASVSACKTHEIGLMPCDGTTPFIDMSTSRLQTQQLSTVNCRQQTPDTKASISSCHHHATLTSELLRSSFKMWKQTLEQTSNLCVFPNLLALIVSSLIRSFFKNLLHHPRLSLHDHRNSFKSHFYLFWFYHDVSRALGIHYDAESLHTNTHQQRLQADGEKLFVVMQEIFALSTMSE